MRSLLLFLALLWTANSSRQINVDPKKCTVEYFCLVDPKVTEQALNEKLLVPAEKLSAHPIDVGIIIKPLTSNKWLLIFYANTPIDVSTGIHLMKIEQGLIRAYDAQDVLRQRTGVVAGCALEKGFLKPYSDDKFSYELRADDSEFKQYKNLLCVGMLTGIGGKKVASLLNEVPTIGYDLRLMYIATDGDTMGVGMRTLRKMSPGTEHVDFSDVDKFITCDFERLKPAVPHVVYTHKFNTALATYSDSIDCTNNLIGTPSSALDMLIKQEKEFIVIKKITCESNKLYYHTEKKTEIVGDAIVGCGERPKCAPPETINCAGCTPPNCVTVGENACEKIECDQWLINDNILHKGKLECRKVSIEDFSDPYWYAQINKKNVRVDKASCKNKYNNCRTKNPIRSICDTVKEGCTTATFTTSFVYCPKAYDMKFKEKLGGQEYDIPAKLKCDTQTGEWKLNGTRSLNETARVNIVYCMLNKTTENVLLSGLENNDEDDNWYWEHTIYLLYAFGAILAVDLVLGTVCLVDYCRYLKKEREEERRLADFTKRTKEEHYRLRPENRHPGLKQHPLFYRDLRNLDHKALCRGLWKEFSLYAPEERVMFLENCLPQFAYGARVVRNVIPLLLKCTELDEPLVDTKQPLHPKLVRIAFVILKILCTCFGIRGDSEGEARIRKVIGIRASNILSDVGLERDPNEDPDRTMIRVYTLEAIMWSGHEETENKLMDIWKTKRENVDTPLRKFVWAVAVKREKFYEVKEEFLDRDRAKILDGTYEAGDIRWGSKIEHYIFAMCANPERNQIERWFFNECLKEPFYTPLYLMAGWQAMLEVFDYNHDVARFVFANRHQFIRKKMPPLSPEYKELFRLIAHYVVWWPNKDTWLGDFWGGLDRMAGVKHFTEEEREALLDDYKTALAMVGAYSIVFKYKGLADHIERVLGVVERKADGEKKKEGEEEAKKKEEEEKKKKKKKPKIRSWKDNYEEPVYADPQHGTDSEPDESKKKKKLAARAARKNNKESRNSVKPGNFATDFKEDGDKEQLELNTARDREEQEQQPLLVERTAVDATLEEQTAADESVQKTAATQDNTASKKQKK